ncbi:MAG: glycosyltransferase family 2 protein [Bryobacteraceae bacterium]
MPEKPVVSVVVLSYRRQGPVAQVLESILRQELGSLEIIIVDNGSGPELTGWLKTTFPQARLIALANNQGPAARNHGIQAARGDFIVTLDNDVYFDDARALHRILEAFERHPKAGCVVFRVYHPATGRLHLRDWCHPRPWREAEHQEFETFYITEGAAAFRREVFRRVEPYWPELFIGHEGFDLGLRIMDAGYEIWYVPQVKVWHLASRETRPDWRAFYYYTRNLFPIVYRNYPLLPGLAHALPRLAAFGLYALRGRFFGKFVRAVWDGLVMLPRCRGMRKPIAAATLHRIRALRRFQPGLWARFLLGMQRMLGRATGTEIARLGER